MAGKRTAEVPDEVIRLSYVASKNDLLEAAFSLAQRASGSSTEGAWALQNELNAWRHLRGLKPIFFVKDPSHSISKRNDES